MPVDVTLVDRRNHHLFQPLLYQVATGMLSPGQIAPADPARRPKVRERPRRAGRGDRVRPRPSGRPRHRRRPPPRHRDPVRQPHRRRRCEPVVLRTRRAGPVRAGHEDDRRRPRAAPADLRRLRDGRGRRRSRRAAAMADDGHRRRRSDRGGAGRAGARARGSLPQGRVPHVRPRFGSRAAARRREGTAGHLRRPALGEGDQGVGAPRCGAADGGQGGGGGRVRGRRRRSGRQQVPDRGPHDDLGGGRAGVPTGRQAGRSERGRARPRRPHRRAPRPHPSRASRGVRHR